MSVSLDDVRHVAALARVGLTDERARALVSELNMILAHMDVLASVDTSNVEEHTGAVLDVNAATPLRPDAGPAIPLGTARESFAPRMRDGFFLVPRLDTHEDSGAAS